MTVIVRKSLLYLAEKLLHITLLSQDENVVAFVENIIRSREGDDLVALFDGKNVYLVLVADIQLNNAVVVPRVENGYLVNACVLGYFGVVENV